jgi:RNA polymerase sigma factor (sigma-70 family)
MVALITLPTFVDESPTWSWVALWRRMARLFVATRRDAGSKVEIFEMAQASVRDASVSMPKEVLQRFQATILPHLDSAYNFARFPCRDADAAGDIVQEAFLRAFRSFETYRGGDARAWVFAIVRNCHRARWANDRERSHFEQPLAISEDENGPGQQAYRIASETETPEATVIRQSEAVHVHQVIANLSEPMREILVLRELEDLSYRQIAEIIDAPIGTVMSRLARARSEFADAWQALQDRGGSR